MAGVPNAASTDRRAELARWNRYGAKPASDSDGQRDVRLQLQNGLMRDMDSGASGPTERRRDLEVPGSDKSVDAGRTAWPPVK